MKDEGKKRRKDDDGEHSSSKHKKTDCSKSNKLSSSFPHYPMSERQQYALLKQMDDDNSAISLNREISETSSNISGHSNDSSSYVSTDRKIQKRNATGETLLIQMAKKGDLNAIKSLIADGANVNEQDYAGWTALHECSIRNYPQIAQYLLQHDADVNLCGLHGDTALHDAVKSNCNEVIKLLVKYGADPRKRNDKGIRPIDLAQSDDIRKMLLMESCATRDKRYKHRDSTGSQDKSDSSNKIKDPYAFEDEENTESCKLTPCKYPKSSPTSKTPTTAASTSWEEKETNDNSEGNSENSNSSPKVPPLRIKIGSTNQSSGLEDKDSQQQSQQQSTTTNKQQQQHNTNSSDSDSSMLSIDITIKTSSKPVPAPVSKPCIFEDADTGDGNGDKMRLDSVKNESILKAQDIHPDSSDLKEETKSTCSISTGRTLRSHTILREKLEEQVDVTTTTTSCTGTLSNENNSGNSSTKETSEKQEKAVTPFKKRKIKRNSDADKSIKIEEQVRGSCPSTSSGETGSSTTTTSSIDSGSTVAVKLEETMSNSESTIPGLLDYQMVMSPYSNPSTSSTTGGNSNLIGSIPVKWENPYRKAALALKTRHKLITQLEIVHPKPPIGFKDYLITTRQYLTAISSSLKSWKNCSYKKRSVPVDIRRKELVNLFMEQEERRYNQAMKHQAEREQLQIVAEQEVIRVHSRAARQLAGQDKAFSFCSIVTLQENTAHIFPPTQSLPPSSTNMTKNSNKNSQENMSTDRLSYEEFIKLLDSIKKKYESEKKRILSRQLHESEALYMLQRLDWEIKVASFGKSLEELHHSADAHIVTSGPSYGHVKLPLDHVPMIEVPVDFRLFSTDPSTISGNITT